MEKTFSFLYDIFIKSGWFKSLKGTHLKNLPKKLSVATYNWINYIKWFIRINLINNCRQIAELDYLPIEAISNFHPLFVLFTGVLMGL